MNGKLIKTGVNYILEDESGVIITSTSLKGDGLSLSLKNCQAIERGYDLDELAEQEFPYDFDPPLFETLGVTEKSYKSILIGMLQGTFQKGFQKALELMGDKKFSEDGLLQAVEMYYGEGKTFIEVIQSLKQTEWDVEIVMDEEKEFIFDPAMGISQGHYLDKPKLDADGCLILNLIK